MALDGVGLTRSGRTQVGEQAEPFSVLAWAIFIEGPVAWGWSLLVTKEGESAAALLREFPAGLSLRFSP